MNFRFVDSLGIGIDSLDLEILEFNTDPYTALLYQHKGDFHLTPQKFGDRNQAEAHSRFIDFLKLAKAENVSLALTPEYSCPWSVINEMLSDDELCPENRKLFALGCESIQRHELDKLKTDFAAEGIKIYFDENVLNANGNFFDPLCYFFKNQNILYLIIQFKTRHMGVWGNPIERDNYKSGREIYVFRNDVSSIYLFTLICSEALNFIVDNNFLNAIDNRWNGNSFIILNPQLNSQPNHPDFKRFKELILSYSNKDLICLNWENGSTLTGEAFINFNCSALHLKTHQIDFSIDTKVISNHLLGLYYLYNGKNNHSFYLSSVKSVYKVRCQKPMTEGVVGVQIRKTEPEVQRVYSWHNGAYEVAEPPIDDGLISFLNQYHSTSTYLRRIDICCVDKERLANLSNGFVKSSNGFNWQQVDNLFSYEMDDSWTINRLTFLEDDEGLNQRIQYIEGIETINKLIIPNKNLWPPTLNTLRNDNVTEVNFEDANVPGKYLYNFIGSEGKATVAFIGFKTKEFAERKMDDLKRIFQDHSKNRIVVWFRTSLVRPEFSAVYNEGENHIADIQVYDPNSILK